MISPSATASSSVANRDVVEVLADEGCRTADASERATPDDQTAELRVGVRHLRPVTNKGGFAPSRQGSLRQCLGRSRSKAASSATRSFARAISRSCLIALVSSSASPE